MTRKLALVVGGAGGIGSAVARRFVKERYDLIIVYRRDRAAAEALAAGLPADCKADLVQCDTIDPDAIEQTLVPCLRGQAPDCYIHCAGGTEVRAVHTMDAEHVSTMVRNNLSSFLLVLPPVFRAMARKGGAIVVLSSIAGYIGLPGQVAYSAAKAGMKGAVRAAAREGGRFNIRVNAVAPGQIDTDALHLPEGAPTPPLKRKGTPAEVAEAVWFLCSPAASYVSGATLPVTGGLYDA